MNMAAEGKETTSSSAGAPRYRLGDITIDVDRRRVERAGHRIRLTKLTFDLLVALAEAAPRVVSREEFGELLWRGRYVSPATIKQRVLLLRQALADNAGHPRYIRVVRGQGYGLIPDVEVVAVETRESRYWQRPATWATAAALSILLIGAAFNHNGLERSSLESEGAPSVEVRSLHSRAKYINDAALIDSLENASRMLQKAIELDPGYLPARLELARTFNLMAGRHLPLGEARRRFRATINAASAIWPNSPSISARRAYIAFRYDGDYATAARHFEYALSMEPVDTYSLRTAMVFALFLNRPADSIRIARYLLAREPECMACYIHVLIGHIKTEQYAEVDEIYEAAKSVNLDRGSLALNYAWSLILRDDAEAALAERMKFGEEAGMELGEAALSAVAFHALGRREEFDASFSELHALTDRDNNRVPIARVHAMTGDMDSAFAILNAMPELDLTIFDEGPRGYGLHDMRQHPHWEDLARKAGLWPDPREEISFNVALPQ